MNVKSSWCNGWNNFLLVLRDSTSDPQSVHYAYSIARAGRERGCEMLGIKKKSHYLSIKVINCASQLATSDKFTKFQFCCPTTHTASFYASSHLWELIAVIWRVVKKTDLAVNTKNQELRKQDRIELVHSTSNASGKKQKDCYFPLEKQKLKCCPLTPTYNETSLCHLQTCAVTEECHRHFWCPFPAPFLRKFKAMRPWGQQMARF